MVAVVAMCIFFFFFSSRRRHTRLQGDWSSDVCSSDLVEGNAYHAACCHRDGIMEMIGMVGVVVDFGFRRPRDRKSTRLNSSHLVISYAVFCLKKKKPQHSSS